MGVRDKRGYTTQYLANDLRDAVKPYLYPKETVGKFLNLAVKKLLAERMMERERMLR